MEECKCINQGREEIMLHCTEIVGKFAQKEVLSVFSVEMK